MNSFKIIKKAEKETKLRARDAGEDDNTNFDLRPAATAGVYPTKLSRGTNRIKRGKRETLRHTSELTLSFEVFSTTRCFL